MNDESSIPASTSPGAESREDLLLALRRAEAERDELRARLQRAEAEAERRVQQAVAEQAVHLQAANEELTSQAEELQAQSEELAATNTSLHAALDESQRARAELERSQKALLNLAEDLSDAKRRLEQANAELHSLDALKDQFISVISHELRTPVNAITGFGSILADGLAGELSPAQKAYVDRILDGADRLIRLINDLLDYSRIQAGELRLYLEPTDVRSAVAEACGLLQGQAVQKGLTLEWSVEGAPAVVADTQRLGQILINLVGNAVKFTPAGGRVTVRVTPSGQFARFEVKDSGPGIASEHLPRLFQRFGQLDTSPTREHQGTGLGLAIVKSLVEAHHGQVGVESKPGDGSTFWFTIPIVPKEKMHA